MRRLLDGAASGARPAAFGVDAALLAMEAPLRRLVGGGVALSLVPGAAGAAVAIDPVDLDRVVTNLVLNARHAMPSGGTLVVSTGEREVGQAVSRVGEAVTPGRHVVVAVRDTGVGMSPEVLARLFEPFFTTRAGQGGTGLGLAGVRALVRAAGGFVAVESAPGEGTTVRVHLPWHEAPPGGVAAVDWAAAGQVGGAAGGTMAGAAGGTMAGAAGGEGGVRGAGPAGEGVVLLVEDEPALLRLGERALSRAGWRVAGVSGVAAALAAVDGGGVVPCAVVVDQALPDGDGLALVDALRLRVPGLPAVLASGYAGAALRARAAGAGVEFLAKPYAARALLELVARVAGPRG